MELTAAGRYRREPKLYRLTFEDYPGLEVTVAALSVGDLMEVVRLAGSFAGRDLAAMDGTAMGAASAAAGDLFDRFAGSLRGWNLDDAGGRPVPADAAGVRSQDFAFVLDLVMAWIDAVASVDTPLPPPASGPGTSQAPPMPMEPLSPTPPS